MTRTMSARKRPKRQSISVDRPPLLWFIYGTSGIGKTSLAAHFPSPVFLCDPNENGIQELVQFKQCPQPTDIAVVDTWEELLDWLTSFGKQVASGKSEAKTLVLDAATGFQKLCFAYHCQTYYNNDWSSEGFLRYYQGPANAAERDWPEFMSLLKQISHDIDVILVGHSETKMKNLPGGISYSVYAPQLDQRIWNATHTDTSIILFYHQDMEYEIQRGTKKRVPVPETESRLIRTTETSLWKAKNRCGLPDTINAGDSPAEAYQNLISAFSNVLTPSNHAS